LAAHPRLIAIVGPTASGKSALALQLAGERAAEIVSCDSLQVYRGLDIGSAKPTPEERQRVPHHLVDVVRPDEPFSAADYARLARAAVASIRDRNRLPIVVGGTGLYLRALLGGLFEGPSRDDALRLRLERVAERRGTGRLHRMLSRVDPEASARIPAADRVRVVRALEVWRATGRPISDHHRTSPAGLPGFAVRVVGLDPDRAQLRAAVERRTEAMMDSGLLDEVRGLLAAGHGPELRPLRAIGYRQAVAVVRGEIGVEQARRDIVIQTMRYAKRQMTWFRHQVSASWFKSPGTALSNLLEWVDRP
jgi:tRNA dimethylallyltransferase